MKRHGESRVLITGISGSLGRLLASRLHREASIIGVDQRPFPRRPKDIEHFQLDIRRKKVEDIFRTQTISAVYHLGILHDPKRSAEDHYTMNLIGSQKILDYVQRYRIPKLVFLSSANIYGARPTNSQFLSEDSALMAATRFPQMRDLVAVDMLVNSFFWKLPETETVILRPVHIVGEVKNAPSKYLRLPVIPTILGFDPMLQLIHEQDVVEALRLARKPGMRGVFNIVGPGALPLSEIIRVLDKPNLKLPYGLFKNGLRRLWNLRVSGFPVPELDFIRFTCMVDGQRARNVLGFEAGKTLRETVESLTADNIYRSTR